MVENTEKLKERLTEERAQLIRELASLGHINPENAEDWELKPVDLDIMQSDANEVADRSEELQENSAILEDLEVRYRNVIRALKKFDNGTFGICEISGEEIEQDRLEANPAARTCKKHMEEDGTLPL